MPGMKLRWMSFGSGGRAGGWRGEAWTCTNLSQMDLFPIFAKTTVCRRRRQCLPSLPCISTLWLDVVVIYIQSKIVHGHNSRKWAGRKHGMATTKCFGLRMAFCSVPFLFSSTRWHDYGWVVVVNGLGLCLWHVEWECFISSQIKQASAVQLLKIQERKS